MSKGWVRTWPYLIKDQLGSELEIVSWGQGGGMDIEQYAERLSTSDWDLAFVFHTGYRSYTFLTDEDFARRFVSIDHWLRDITSTGLREVIHFHRESRQYQFQSGRRQHGVIEQLDWNRHNRVRTSPDVSDNLIDQVGNWTTAQLMLRLIQEFQERRQYTLQLQQQGLINKR
jgi:hypothetical protein